MSDAKRTADPGLVNIYGGLLDFMKESGYVRPDDENIVDTAERAARGFSELVLPLSVIEEQKNALLSAHFPSKYGGMIISKHNLAFGLCPHHLLPVIYRVSVAYLPRTRVLGISKLSRLVKLFARSPILQEDLTAKLADTLFDDLDSMGSAVYVEGLHLCMASRGVEVHDARVVTSEVRGRFLEQPATRTEFLDLVRAVGPRLV